MARDQTGARREGLEVPERGPLYPAAVGVAWVSGVLVAAAVALLAANRAQREPWNPLDVAEYRELKAALAKSPDDEGLKAKIRALDLELRKEHFARLSFSARGAYPLLGAALLFVLSMKWVLACRRPLPSPGPAEAAFGAPPPAPRAGLSAAALAVAGLATAAGAVALACARGPTLSREALELAPTARAPAGGAEPEPAFPSAEEVERAWPRFRGPRGDGVSRHADVPDSFDVASGRGIVWKVEVPLPGHGSPVLWGDRIFLAGADERREEVLSYDARSGKLLWREALAGEPGREPPEVLEATGFAASTPATDGRRVYAIFATGDLAAFEVSGKRLWERKLGPIDSPYGYGTSLVLEGPLLYVVLDQGAEGEGKSRLLALRALSGETAWEAKRPVAASWATPIAIAGPRGRQLVTSANPLVIAYDPETGKEIWRADCMAGDVAPSPIFAGGLVFAANVDAELCAIRPDGEGDVTETHIAWRGEDGLPDIASPASDGSLVFVVAPNGRLTCYDARKGDVVWEEKLKTPCHASPSVVGDRLHLWAKKGTLIVVKVARAFEELARSELGEDVHASPAFAAGRIYVRGAANLWCLGRP